MTCSSRLWLLVLVPVMIAACSKQQVPTATVLEAEALDDEMATATVDTTATPVFLAWEDPPKAIKRVMPQYPKEALQDGVEGRVILNIVVDENGVVQDATVVTADPPGIFDQAAIDAMKQWAFEPARQAGQAIKVRLAYPIQFTLEAKEY